MKVICKTKSDKIKNLTVGKVYEVLDETDTKYIVNSDNNENTAYYKTIFKKDLIEKEEFLKRFNLDNISYNNNSNRYNIAISNLTGDFYIKTTDISCGILQLSGINSISLAIESKLYEYRKSVSHLDYNDLFKSIIKKIFNQILSHNIIKGMLLVSTNTDNYDEDYDEYDSVEQYQELMIEVLDEISMTFADCLNLNSDNNIRVWVLHRQNN